MKKILNMNFTQEAREFQVDIKQLVLTIILTKDISALSKDSGTYGSEEDKLEIMGLLTEIEEEEDSVRGWLTAEEVFKRIKKHIEEEKEDYENQFYKRNFRN